MEDFKKEIRELRYLVLALRNTGNLDKEAELKLLTKMNGLTEQLSIANVSQQSEQLKVEDLKDFAREVCPLHRLDDLDKIIDSL